MAVNLDNNEIQLVRSTMYQVFDSLVVKYTYTTMLCIVQILWAVCFQWKTHPLLEVQNLYLNERFTVGFKCQQCLL